MVVLPPMTRADTASLPTLAQSSAASLSISPRIRDRSFLRFSRSSFTARIRSRMFRPKDTWLLTQPALPRTWPETISTNSISRVVLPMSRARP